MSVELNHPSRKYLLSLLIPVLILLSHNAWLNNLATEYTQQGFERALITYGISRGLNGLISVAQGTEVAVEPVGVGMTFTPGQILDPVNDLIERFSTIVLASGATLGMQRILIDMTSSLWLNIGLSLLLGFLLLLAWKPEILDGSLRNWVFRLSLVLLIIRFVVPVSAMAGELVYQSFLKDQYQESKAVLQQSANDLQQINDEKNVPVVEQSFWQKLDEFMSSASDSIDVQKHMDELKQSVAEISENVINLMTVFIFQTLLIPLFFLWLAYLLIKISVRG